ncbi:MAG: hypothetical protein IID42_01640 [Planctomycetes bacterium]|nr:hypothetical protein [Planctomycetota bacterium]
MQRLMIAIFVVGMTITGLVGCASMPGPHRPVRRVKVDLLFNPEWTGVPTFDVSRSSWPSTPAYLSVGEVVDYQETIYDLQGRSSRGQGDYYRRQFKSVRIGRSYR